MPAKHIHKHKHTKHKHKDTKETLLVHQPAVSADNTFQQFLMQIALYDYYSQWLDERYFSFQLYFLFMDIMYSLIERSKSLCILEFEIFFSPPATLLTRLPLNPLLIHGRSVAKTKIRLKTKYSK